MRLEDVHAIGNPRLRLANEADLIVLADLSVVRIWADLGKALSSTYASPLHRSIHHHHHERT